MREYPKVPRYDHPVIEDKFPGIYEGEVVLLEKLDGCCFRVMLYDERYAEHYTEEVKEMAEDNQLVYGSKRVVKGTEGDIPYTSSGDVDIRFMGGYTALKNIDKDKVREYHDEYNSPLVLFCECMTFHHKEDYDGENNIIGFEVALQDKSIEEHTGNPYDEEFVGYLKWDTASDILEDVGITTTVEVDRFESGIDIENYEIPETSFGEGTMEGVVIRNDNINRRSKKVHPKYRELNDRYFGKSDFDSVEEELTAKYCTEGRMIKNMKKMMLNEGADIGMSIIPDLADRVYEDIWSEEWYTIKDMDRSFNPSDFYDEVINRCAGFTERIVKFAESEGVDVEYLVENEYY